MKFEEIIKNLRSGQKIRRRKWKEDNYWYINSKRLICNQDDTAVIAVLTPVLYAEDWEVYEEKELLTDKERTYLSIIIEPFRDKVGYISKKRNSSDKGQAHICIFGKGSTVIATLPWMKITEKYNGMQLDKNYKLEDLGL